MKVRASVKKLCRNCSVSDELT
ncbi:50S ribosomal protein L36 [Klebsiella pneumoniae]|nr:50S ribosomal protein L36 [Klebsiella pneumoniae]